MTLWTAVVHLLPSSASDWLPPSASGAFVRIAARGQSGDEVRALVEAHLGPLADVERVDQLAPLDDSSLPSGSELFDLADQLRSTARSLVLGIVHTYGDEASE